MMDGVLVDSFNGTCKVDSSPLSSVNFEALLKESIHRFLQEKRNPHGDLSEYRSIFFRLLQSCSDPPLEVIWFYSAVSLSESRILENHGSDTISVSRELLQILSACSAVCDGTKSIALLAPVLYKLFCSLSDSSLENRAQAKLNKLTRDVCCLAEAIIGYIGICSSNGKSTGDTSLGLSACFRDSVTIWTVGNHNEALRMFFPLISEKMLEELLGESCNVAYLAAVVIIEALFLCLSLKINSGAALPRLELQQELRLWTVGALTGFHNRLLIYCLLQMLLDPVLPVALLKSHEDELMLRNIIFEALLFPEYSFVNPETKVSHSDEQTKYLLMMRLVAAHKAIHFLRCRGDIEKAILYTDVFSRSRLYSDISEWIRENVGNCQKLDYPNPEALLQTLQKLEDIGVELFAPIPDACSISRVLHSNDIAYRHTAIEEEAIKPNYDLFFVDSKGEEQIGDDQDMEFINTEFVVAAQRMTLAASAGRSKRKGARSSQEKVKFLKHKLQGH